MDGAVVENSHTGDKRAAVERARVGRPTLYGGVASIGVVGRVIAGTGRAAHAHDVIGRGRSTSDGRDATTRVRSTVWRASSAVGRARSTAKRAGLLLRGL